MFCVENNKDPHKLLKIKKCRGQSFSWLLSNSQLEEAYDMLALCTSSYWLLLSNQDKKLTPALAQTIHMFPWVCTSSLVRAPELWSRKFKGGIGSLFDPVLTLWGGGHIGSSRMEQSYCTSGVFRQRVTLRNHSNYQLTPRRRSIIAYGKRENTRCDKCVAVCMTWFIFLAAPFYAFQTFPGKAQLFSRLFFFSLRFKCCD